MNPVGGMMPTYGVGFLRSALAAKQTAPREGRRQGQTGLLFREQVRAIIFVISSPIGPFHPRCSFHLGTDTQGEIANKGLPREQMKYRARLPSFALKAGVI